LHHFNFYFNNNYIFQVRNNNNNKKVEGVAIERERGGSKQSYMCIDLSDKKKIKYKRERERIHSINNIAQLHFFIYF
jgi:hypothetical protein